MSFKDNLFDVVPDNFFQPLYSKNKRFYSWCALELYEQSLLTEAAEFTRQFVYAIINVCLDQFQEALLDDEGEPFFDSATDGVVQDSSATGILLTKERVYYKFRDCGWIVDEFDENRVQLVSFTIPASTLMPTIKKIAQPTRISLGGYTRSIIQSLEAVFTSKQPYQEAFRLAVDTTTSFMQELSKITQAIKADLTSITECQDSHEMAALLIEYLNNNSEGEYSKLQFDENLTPDDRSKINRLLLDIEVNESLFESMVQGVKKYFTLDTDEEATVYLAKSIDAIRARLCVDYVRKTADIQRFQARYIASANTKISLLNVDRKNASDAINNIILAMSNIPDEDFEDSGLLWVNELQSTLLLPQVQYIKDVDCLHKARSVRYGSSFNVSYIPNRAKMTISKDDFLHAQNAYTVHKANCLLDELIGDKSQLCASDFPLACREDFYNLVSVVLFGNHPELKYTVTMKGCRLNLDNYIIDDFTVMPKISLKEV